MRWKLVLRTLLYGSSLAAFVATLSQVAFPNKALAQEPNCCLAGSENSCPSGYACTFTNEACNQSTANDQGWTCVKD